MSTNVAVAPFMRQLTIDLKHTIFSKVKDWVARSPNTAELCRRIKSIYEKCRGFHVDDSTFYVSPMGEFLYHSFPEQESGWVLNYRGMKFWVATSAYAGYHFLMADLIPEVWLRMEPNLPRKPYMSTIFTMALRWHETYERYAKISVSCEITSGTNECAMAVVMQRQSYSPDLMTDEHIKLGSLAAVDPFIPENIIVDPYKPLYTGLDQFLEHIDRVDIEECRP